MRNRKELSLDESCRASDKLFANLRKAGVDTSRLVEMSLILDKIQSKSKEIFKELEDNLIKIFNEEIADGWDKVWATVSINIILQRKFRQLVLDGKIGDMK